MAGNIIPAIATTNAIIAGLIVLQALHLLHGAYDALVWPFLTAKPNKPITGSQLPPPNPECGACSDTYTIVRCNPKEVTLGELVSKALEHTIIGDGADDALDVTEVSVYEAGRLLADPDFESNLDKTLADLGCEQGKFLSLVDEDERWNTLTVAICSLPLVSSSSSSMPNAGTIRESEKASQLLLPTSRPRLKPKFKPAAPPTVNMEVDRTTLKRKHNPEETTTLEGEDGPVRKKIKPNSRLPSASPSKAQRLEEEGLVLLEDDVIILD